MPLTTREAWQDTFAPLWLQPAFPRSLERKDSNSLCSVLVVSEAPLTSLINEFMKLALCLFKAGEVPGPRGGAFHRTRGQLESKSKSFRQRKKQNTVRKALPRRQGSRWSSGHSWGALEERKAHFKQVIVTQRVRSRTALQQVQPALECARGRGVGGRTTRTPLSPGVIQRVALR